MAGHCDGLRVGSSLRQPGERRQAHLAVRVAEELRQHHILELLVRELAAMVEQLAAACQDVKVFARQMHLRAAHRLAGPQTRLELLSPHSDAHTSTMNTSTPQDRRLPHPPVHLLASKE